MAELTMQNLGGATQVAPAVVESVWGRVGMFIHSSATHTVHLRWREMDGSLAAWEDLQSPIAGAPVAARAYDGRTGVYFRNPDGRLVCQRQNNDGSAWITDITDAKLRGNPVVGHNANRRMEVFVEGDDGALWHLWATGDGPELGASGRFGGSNVRAIAWALTTGGRQAFFHTNTANELWLIQQTAPNGGWSAFSGPAKDIPADLSAVGFAGDRLAVVFTDANGAVQLRAEPPGGGTLGGSLALSASGTKARGRPTGFRLQDERLLAVWWQQTPRTSSCRPTSPPWKTLRGSSGIWAAPSSPRRPSPHSPPWGSCTWGYGWRTGRSATASCPPLHSRPGTAGRDATTRTELATVAA